ncbi:hypothetical protein ABPG72_012753 [Tetrahymena utriculariae]
MPKHKYYVVGFKGIYGKPNLELKTNNYEDAVKAMNTYVYHSSLIYNAQTNQVLFSPNMATEKFTGLKIKIGQFIDFQWNDDKWMSSVTGELAEFASQWAKSDN